MSYKTPTCPIASKCGACELLAVPYPIQLERKKKYLESLFSDYSCPVEDVLGMDEPSEFRYKVQTPFVCSKSGKILFGMYKRSSHNVIMSQQCLTEAPQARPIFETIVRLAKCYKISIYNEDTGKGLLRHAIIRIAHVDGSCLLTLVVNRKEFPHKRDFVHELIDEHPEITSVVFNINTRQTNAILGPQYMTAYGQDWIEDELCGCVFRIPAGAFYQTNPLQTEVLYKKAIEFANIHAGNTVLDTYCGIGTIGIVAAKHAKAPKSKKTKKRAAKKHALSQGQPVPIHLIGVESQKEAVDVALGNARLNHIKNAEFICADAGEFMQQLDEDFSVDVLFMDPPRAGASEEFIQAVLKVMPKRIIYISCNPQTQVRDINMLSVAYSVERIAPVDMFPHTKHIETVVLLIRK